MTRKEINKTWKDRNKKRLKKYNKEYKKNNPEYKSKLYTYIKSQSVKRKRKVLTYYGPDGRLGCCWMNCLVIDIDMLSLDHVNNDGAKHRRELGAIGRNKGRSVYRDVEKRGFPPGFQTLCFNHQMKKQFNLRKKLIVSDKSDINR